MKKVLFGIFAHPDDEAFGPAASLYNAAQNGADIHLVLVTDGAAGTNHEKVTDLIETRRREWEKSGQLIGIKSSTALHYADGALCNNLYHEITGKIRHFIETTISRYHTQIEVEFITFESGGISGHLDHIAVHFITTYLFLRLRETHPSHCTVGTLKYFCLSDSIINVPSTGWLYMPAGKSAKEIDEIFDYTHLAKKRLEIMAAHASQHEDMQNILDTHTDDSGKAILKDHFVYFKG